MILLIILGTYLLEDAAIISTALLSVDGVISPEVAFLTLFIGVFTGDLGLYKLGMMLGRWQWLARRINSNSIKQAGQWLEKQMTLTILLVRLLPGLRLPTYLACGYFTLPFSWFFLLAGFASFFWTGVVFFGFYWFGKMFWSDLSSWKWLLVPIIIGLVFAVKTVIARANRITNSRGLYGRTDPHRRDC